MGLDVRFSPRAVADLQSIRAYLIERSPKGAERVRQAIVATIDHCAEYPQTGNKTDRPGVLRVPLHRYRFTIFYRLSADGQSLELLRVLRSGRVKTLRKMPGDPPK